MARAKAKPPSGGEGVRESIDRESLLGMTPATPGVPGSLETSTDVQQLAGTMLRGHDGIRFSTGRRDGRAPAIDRTGIHSTTAGLPRRNPIHDADE